MADPALAITSVIGTSGKVTVNYTFTDIPEPASGNLRYVLWVNSNSYLVGVDATGAGTIGLSCCAINNIGAVVLGNGVYERFDQEQYLASCV